MLRLRRSRLTACAATASSSRRRRRFCRRSRLRWRRRCGSRAALTTGRRQRVTVGIERLAQAALSANLDSRLLIDRELLFVRDSGRGRTPPAILRQQHRALIQPRRHVVAWQACAA